MISILYTQLTPIMYKIKARPGLALATFYLLTTGLVSGQNLEPGSPCYKQDEQGEPILTEPEVRKAIYKT